MLKMNMNMAVKVVKGLGKYASPLITGVGTVITEIKNQKLHDTVLQQGKKLAELEAKINKMK